MRSDHDRELSDGGNYRFLPIFTLHEGQLEHDRCSIGKVLSRASLGKRSPCDPSASLTSGFFTSIFPLYPDRFCAFTANLYVGLNNTLLIDNFLEICLEKIVE